MMAARRGLLATLGYSLLFSFDSAAQVATTQGGDGNATVPTLVAIRMPEGEAARVDGRLEESFWSTAPSATNFVQREPDNGAPATERSEVRVAYDATRLVIGARLLDSEPDRILGNQMQRDEGFGADDRFIVTIDPFLDGRTGYIFQTNPLGSLQDGLITARTDDEGDVQDFGSSLNRSWDGIWMVRVERAADGWTVEMEIPFATINFDPTLVAWGINFQRTIRRKAEETVWTGHLRNQGVAHMASAGRLEGLSGLSQGVGLDVKPYVLGNVSREPGGNDAGAIATGDVGVDIFYNVTPALRATLSINTDFAETEVDERRVNLTRFPLFFEEKREFFLQGANFFDFAREVGNSVVPFFSRRIGLDEEGAVQAIDVGGKLTGQSGPFDLGVLYVRTADEADRRGEDFSVARVRRRFFQESYVGGLVTRRAGAVDAPELHTFGIDGVLRTSQFLGHKTVEWSGWYLYTTNPAQTGQNIGRGSRLSFPNDPFFFDMSFRELQPFYDPAVGYTERAGFRRVNPLVGYAWRFGDNRWFQSIEHEIDWEWLYDMDNRLLTEVAQVKPLTIRFSEGSEFAYEVHPTYERLEEDFHISDGIVLPAGEDYRFTRHELSAEMADQYPVALEGRVRFGSFYSGHGTEYEAAVNVRPRAGVALELEAERNSVNLPEGRFTTNLFRFNTNTQFSPWLSLVNNLQYDDVTKLLGWQLRFRWIQRPGNDLFFVYTHNWQETVDSGGRHFATLDNRAASKLVYTLRF